MKNNLENQDIKTDKPVPMSYEALKADRDAQQKRADALAVRNEQLMSFAVEVFNVAAQHCTLNRDEIHSIGEGLGLFGHETYQPVLHGYHCGHEAGEDSVYVITKSATSAAPAAVRTQGVEQFIAEMLERGNEPTNSLTESVRADMRSAATFARLFIELREAK
ncbi:hypothetical protein AB6848_11200 [Serratia proteamaculans]|uniref:hypothetical protein n=1 Tax=Serratia proteamaculans TaxID=28151 RepID=UPI0039BE9713